MIAGFETPTAGTLTINGKDQRPLKPNQRNIGMVFQAYALFPNMTVHDNVAFGLKVAGMAKPDIDKRVKEMLALIKLDHLATRFPYQMSGGQQQRVALARAIAVKPQVLLLDEPLSALDAKIRVSLREEIRAIQQQLGITTVFVTHDQEEALSISDRIVVMNAGRADQIGSPFEIYNTPATRFVASFVGTLNLIEGKVVDPDNSRIMIGDQDVTLKQSVTAYKPGDTVSLALRPEAGSLAESAKGDTAGFAPGGRLTGRIGQGRHGADRRSFLGALPGFGYPHPHERRRQYDFLRYVQQPGHAAPERRRKGHAAFCIIRSAGHSGLRICPVLQGNFGKLFANAGSKARRFSLISLLKCIYSPSVLRAGCNSPPAVWGFSPSPRAPSGFGRVSRSGARPEPTV
ncbi:Spermidine/putrescine import ATP-binding protein PotA [Ensifer adhaerens]|nr:Spermidine/putrescine import ATP-binding protein PotA [Ensifer adhaerens]